MTSRNNGANSSGRINKSTTYRSERIHSAWGGAEGLAQLLGKAGLGGIASK